MKVLRSKHCPLSSIHPPLHSSSFTRLKGLPLLDTNFYATTWQRLQLSRSLRRPSRVPLDFPTNLSRFYLLKRPCCLYLQVRYSNSLCVVSYTPTPTEQFRIAIFTSRNSSRSPLPHVLLRELWKDVFSIKRFNVRFFCQKGQMGGVEVQSRSPGENKPSWPVVGLLLVFPSEALLVEIHV